MQILGIRGLPKGKGGVDQSIWLTTQNKVHGGLGITPEKGVVVEEEVMGYWGGGGGVVEGGGGGS